MPAPLTKATLVAAREQGEQSNVTDLASRVAGLFDIEKQTPFIGVVDTKAQTLIGGRFFPKEIAILVYRNHDAEVTGALIAHELGHWVSYVVNCRAVPRKHKTTARCSYVGQHDRKFYAILEKIHLELGVSTRAARLVEGRYAYPKHWNNASWS